MWHCGQEDYKTVTDIVDPHGQSKSETEEYLGILSK